MSEPKRQMDRGLDAVLSEEDARAVLRHAVQLQAESAQAVEDEARLPAAQAEPDTAGAGFSVVEVEAAAAEVGIAPEFVKLALLEVRGLAGTASVAKPVPRWLDRTTTFVVGSDRRMLVATRVIDAPPAEVFEAMQRVFPPILTLKDVIGEPVAAGGVLSFDVAAGSSAFGADMVLADIKHVDVAIHPVHGQARQTRVIVTAGLDYSRRLNRWLGGGASALAGALGGSGGAGLAGSLFGLAGVGMIVPFAAGAALVGAVGIAGVRRVYRWGLGRGSKGLDRLIHMLDVHMRTGGAFAAPAEQPGVATPPFIPPHTPQA